MRIRPQLERERALRGGNWTAAEFIDIHNKLAAEYNAKQDELAGGVGVAYTRVSELGIIHCCLQTSSGKNAS
jgi:hypothetical protein